MSLVSLVLGRRGASGFGYASTAEEVTAGVELSGKTMLVTGVNSGLGLETARVLAMRGARVVGAARTEEKAAEALAGIAGAVPVACELSEPSSVKACVEKVRSLGFALDAVIANAGIMALPERTVKYGHELQFFTNHVGHFLLVTGLVDSLSAEGRVVMLSSAAHQFAPRGGIVFDDLSFERGYSPNRAYGQSKLANLLFAKSLAKRFRGSKRTANAVHPGVIATNLTRHMSVVVRATMPVWNAIALKSVAEGAATQCYVAAHPSVAGVSGEYFADSNVAKTSAYARDEALADRLWDVTEKIVAGL